MDVIATLVTRAASSNLKSKFSRTELDEVVGKLRSHYDELVPGVPHEKTTGARLMVKVVCAADALYRSLLTCGVEEDEAIRLVSDTTRLIFEKMVMPTRLVASLPFPNRFKMLRWYWNLLNKRFPFNPPGWITEDVEKGTGILAFDYRRCPIAYYCQLHGLTALGAAAFCSHDYRLWEMWHATLQRSRTLMEGGDRCDFWWHINS